MGEILAKYIGPLVAIAIAVISASISIGASRAEIEVLKDQNRQLHVDVENATRTVHALEIEQATSKGTLGNIDRSLVEIKDDIKDLKRGQGSSSPAGTIRLK